MTESNLRIPEYHVENLEDQLKVSIIAPLSKPDEASFLIVENELRFISNPYFLKLKLPHPVFDIPEEQDFDGVTNSYVIKLKKCDSIASQGSEGEQCPERVQPQENHTDETSTGGSVNGNKEKQFYGFGNSYSNVFGKLSDAFSEVINLPDPDTSDRKLRRVQRLKEQNEKWNDDHYLADTMETDHLESIFKYKPPWQKQTHTCESSVLNDDMKEILESCTKPINFELSGESVKLSKLQIVEILFCYAYDKRTTEGDKTVESGWTINKLSSTLSWLDVFEDLKSVLVACYQRSLIYPLYRNWKLAEMVHRDVADILKCGSAQVTHSLLEVKEIFDESENRYVLNTLYMNNLCWFSHNTDSKEFVELSEEVSKMKIKKYEVNPDIPYLEVAAHLTVEEETEGHSGRDVSKIVDEISRLKLQTVDSTTSESSTESSDSSTDSSEDSSESSDSDD